MRLAIFTVPAQTHDNGFIGHANHLPKVYRAPNLNESLGVIAKWVKDLLARYAAGISTFVTLHNNGYGAFLHPGYDPSTIHEQYEHYTLGLDNRLPRNVILSHA